LQFKFPGSNKTRVSTSRVLAEGSSMTYTRVEGPYRLAAPGSHSSAVARNIPSSKQFLYCLTEG